MEYVEDSVRLVIAYYNEARTWQVYTQRCTDGVWEDDEALGEAEVERADWAMNSAVTMAILAGYAPGALAWRRMAPPVNCVPAPVLAYRLALIPDGA